MNDMQHVNRAVLSDGKWKVSLGPSVGALFKRLFDGVDKVGHELELSDTPANAKNLLWFAERHPILFSPQMHVLAQASVQEEREEAVQRILSSEYTPSNARLALPLRDYQARAVDLTLANGAILLGDDVGIGKTASCIGVLARPEALPAVVVTLTALPIQWRREIARFAPELRSHVVKTSKPYPLDYARGKRVPLPDVVVMSYSKLTTRTGGRSWAEVLADENLCRTLVFDEGQELRNSESERYKAAKYLRTSATYCVLATATPVYNHGGEIHNVVDIVQPGALGDRKEFLREWCGKDPGEEGSTSGEMRKIRVKDPVALGAHLRDTGVMLRRTRAEVGRELPPLQRIFHPIETDGLEIPENVNIEALCRTVLRAGASGAEKMKAAGELDWRLRQATGLAKAPEVASLVRLLIESGEKVVLYGWHRSVYDMWAEMFGNKDQGDLKPAWYTGSESVTQKDEARRRFVENETDLIILSLRSGAGLDGLQFKTKIVVFGEFDWSPGVMEQNEGRVFRDGQKYPVSAYYAYTDEGSDPVLMDVLNLKTEQSEGIRNLTSDVVKLQGVDPNNIRRLAEAYLRKLGKL